MPLPAALAARLAKRGLLKKGSQTQAPPIEQTPIVEEIIAEDYDDHKRDSVNDLALVPLPNEVLKLKEEADKQDKNKENKLGLMGHPGCPNKYIIYHECTDFCKIRWGKGRVEGNPINERRRMRMLKKYPLPSMWREIYDPGLARHYYWNIESDKVSWLPPLHPRASLGECAAKLRGIMLKKVAQAEKEKKIEEQKKAAKLTKKMDIDSDASSDEEERERKREDKRREREKQRDKERSKGRPKVRENDLDPMDPASYSEAPRGSWSSGLARLNDAKTGADVTASGPLYQMRPYPNPGAVLRANAEAKKK